MVRNAVNLSKKFVLEKENVIGRAISRCLKWLLHAFVRLFHIHIDCPQNIVGALGIQSLAAVESYIVKIVEEAKIIRFCLIFCLGDNMNTFRAQIFHQKLVVGHCWIVFGNCIFWRCQAVKSLAQTFLVPHFSKTVWALERHYSWREIDKVLHQVYVLIQLYNELVRDVEDRSVPKAELNFAIVCFGYLDLGL